MSVALLSGCALVRAVGHVGADSRGGAGGYIISCSNSLTDHMKPENVPPAPWSVEDMLGWVGRCGTDAPMRDPRPELGRVVWADLPVESRRRILGHNFRRLLSLRKER